MKILSTILLVMSVLGLNAQSPIDIKWSGTTANVNIPADVAGVTATVEGANVSITSVNTDTEYTYRLSGSSTDGSLNIYGDYKLTLQLAGLSLTNAHGGAAIDVECGKRIAVELVKGTRNSLADTDHGSQKAALYFKGHAEFEGHGTLNVTGHLKHAICAKEYIELKATTGTINVLGAVSDGIHCGKGKAGNEHNYFLMRGGNVNILNVGADGIDSDDYGTLNIEGGTVSINTGDGATALKADSLLNISGGKVSISVTGDDSEGLRSRYRTTISGGQTDIIVTGNGSKAIKGKRYEEEATVLDGGYVDISGGEVNIHVLGGNLKDVDTGDISKCMGISVDADFLQTGGTVNITALGPETYTYNVKGSESSDGGTINTVSTPWALNPTNFQYDMSAYVVVRKAGTACTDYTGKAVGAFIGTQCVGYAVFPAGANYGIMRLYSDKAADNGTMSFRLYDNDAEYRLIPSQTVTFAAQTAIGTPEMPLELDCPAYELSDINHDKTVDNLDVECLACKLVGKTHSTTFNSAQADIDGDGNITIADLTRIVMLILKRQEGQGM